MFYNSSRICTDEGLLDLNVTSFTKKEIQLLKYVTDPKLLDLSLLPGEQEVLELFMDLDASDEQLDCPFVFASAKAGFAKTRLEDPEVENVLLTVESISVLTNMLHR